MFTAALVTISSPNFDVVVDFYTQFFATKPQPYMAGGYAEFMIGGLRLGIFQPAPGNLAEFGNPSESALSVCLEVTNLEQAIDKLTQLGYPPPGQIITASHGREIYAYDTDGNRLILHQSR